ncbi:MAG: hypothetical protein LBS25_05175 [Candidatus Symbiothrix sp.]|jgi:uncharacterized protein YfaS (alpha-2-macroglobulin family)|nr:hypothetical protein [Candidatus Symbiothrix sp.]
MKRFFVILMGMMCASLLSAQTNRWEQVAELEEQSLPKSALEVVNRIYSDAVKTGNSPEKIKALIYRLKYTNEIDSDSLSKKLSEMAQLAETGENSIEQAVLYSLIAQFTVNYPLPNIDSNKRKNDITACVSASVFPAEKLRQTPISEYQDLILPVDSGMKPFPTLYDLIVKQGITSLQSLYDNDLKPQIDSLYREWIAFREQQVVQNPSYDNRFFLLMAHLEQLDFTHNQTNGYSKNPVYVQALQRLQKKYEADDFCVEILSKAANYCLQNVSAKAAYAICNFGIEHYPNYLRIGLLKNQLESLTQKQIEVQSPNVVYPGKDLELQLNYKNISRIKVEIYKIGVAASAYEQEWNRFGKYKKWGVLQQTYPFDLKNELPYIQSDTILKIPMNDLGTYEYVISGENANDLDEPVNQSFTVSRLATVSRTINGEREFWVTDRMSGKPIVGAKIRFYQRAKNSQKLIENGSVTTDKFGLAQGGSDKNTIFYNASSGNDTALIISSVPWISRYNSSEGKADRRLHLFTDRSIYRPGQTIYFKGIATEISAKSTNVIPNKNYSLTFRDANGQEIASKKLKTNDFGSFSGEFSIPQALLNGAFSIQAENGFVSVQVEEYKRPTFDIQFLPNEQSYRFGDSVSVKGSVATFSGVKIPATDVKYSIRRQSHWLCRIYQNPEIIATGTAQTDAEGCFEIKFVPNKNQSKSDFPQIYTYNIETIVTQSNGETQKSETAIHIGEKSIFLNINGLTSVVDKNRLQEIRIQAVNLSDTPIAAEGNYTLYSLKTNRKLLSENELNDTTNWQIQNNVAAGKFSSDSILNLTFKNLTSGRYRLALISKDLLGREVIEQQDFTLTSDADKHPPIPVYQWLRLQKDTCRIGEKAEIIFGSSAENVSVLYEIFAKDKRVSLSNFILNNANKTLSIPFLESYGDGVSVVLSFVKDGKFFTKNIPVYKKQEDKSLQLKMEVFRDRLQPGQKEEWRISIKDKDNQPVISEILAEMYDASLDKIRSHGWYFNAIRPLRISSVHNQPGNVFEFSHRNEEKTENFVITPDIPALAFNWFGLEFYLPRNIRYKLQGKLAGIAIATDEMAESQITMRGVENKHVIAYESAMVNEIASVTISSPSQIRQNFAETAFFYPQLTTNEAGETQIAFVVPESVTTWKFNALAHTKDLKFGQIAHEIITQKPLMIAPNIPRFMREGDRIMLSTNISNLSEKNINGKISIQCFNPETNETNIIIADSIQAFSLEAGKTTTVSWTFDIPVGQAFTTVKIIAQSPDFSDGEQHLIPVLPNRTLVTETLPITVPGKSTRSFDVEKWLKKDSSTAQSQGLALELTSNPTWYAIAALPSLSIPQSDNVLDWFSAYYSNNLATQIVQSSPKIQTMIKLWKQQNSSVLQSNLEKNSELKNLLLEETPWLMEARDESEQKQQLAQFFDSNRIENFNRQALEKLQSLQCYDGGWSWFKDMKSNVSITQWILYGLKQIDNQFNSDLQKRAIAFIDQQFKEHYEQLKKQKSTNISTLSTYELEYLFVRSLYPDFSNTENDEAVRFYTSALEKSWPKDKNLYHKALTGIILNRSGNKTAAQSILKSLREYALQKPDLGMFWANNRINSFASQSAVCVHTFIMQAFSEIGATPAETEAMKLWLLNQKRSQHWESVPATVQAVQTLLSSGDDWSASTEPAKITWGNIAEAPSSSEPGTGYLKILKNLKNLENLKDLTIEQPNPAPAYGSLYHQYFEDLDKITSAGTDLNLEKMLFIEKNTTAGKTFTPVSEKQPLQIGDKVIVRIALKAKRDMEFVSLKDARPACFEPVEPISGTIWKNGLVYYQSTKDASNQFFFNVLSKGMHIVEYAVFVTAAGDYSSGIASLQCLYAPEFSAQTSGGRISVAN